MYDTARANSRRRPRCAARIASWLLCWWFALDFAESHEPRPPAPRPAKVVAVARKTYAATCQLTISLIDQETKAPLPGIVQVRDADGDLVELGELVNRGQGIEQKGPIHEWWVLARPTVVVVPATALEIRALSGLETELSRQNLDLTGRSRRGLHVPLARFYRARKHGHVAGNTHLHLMKLSKQQADRYLQEVPLADGLEVVFLSYRAGLSGSDRRAGETANRPREVICSGFRSLSRNTNRRNRLSPNIRVWVRAVQLRRRPAYRRAAA